MYIESARSVLSNRAVLDNIRIVRGRLSYGMADRTLRHMTGEPIITVPFRVVLYVRY
jgi:hypothetical protein